MNPAQYDIQLYRGDFFELTLRLREGTLSGGGYVPGNYLDLTGWEAPMAQIRATEDATTILASFTTEVLNQTTTPGAVRLFLTPADTGTLPAAAAVWDVQLTDPESRVYTYLRGKVTITKDVTR